MAIGQRPAGQLHRGRARHERTGTNCHESSTRRDAASEALKVSAYRDDVDPLAVEVHAPLHE